LELDGIGILFKWSAFFPILGLYILAGLVGRVTGIVTIASAVPAVSTGAVLKSADFVVALAAFLAFLVSKAPLTLDYTPGCTVQEGAEANANRHRREGDWSQR
jgi:hypothetical protein